MRVTTKSKSRAPVTCRQPVSTLTCCSLYGVDAPPLLALRMSSMRGDR
jgi:hypothetical protein